MSTRLRSPSVAAVVGGAAALWGLAIGLQPLGDNSALTHLATGRFILDHGVPRRDPFSFTAAGHAWTVSSWLASVGMALAERANAGYGVLVAHAVLTTLLAVLAWRLTRSASSMAGRILPVSVVLAVGTGSWPERPLLIGLVFLAIVVLVTESDVGSPWFLLPVMWFWVNTHGSFPLGLVYIGVRMVGRRLDGAPAGRLPVIAKAALVGTLLGGINPVGPRLIVFPLELLKRHDLLARVVEWRSPDFSRPANLVFLAGFLVAVLLAGRRCSWEDGLVAVVFGAAACLGQRNIALGSIALAPVLARDLAHLGAVRGDNRNKATGVAALALVALAALLAVNSFQRPAYDLSTYPVAELNWMGTQGLLETRVATQDFVGNLLLLREGATARVFFDDRYDLYPRTLITDSWKLLDGNEGWQGRLNRYRIDTLLWQRKKPLAGLVASDPDWRVVRRSTNWIVAVRSGQ